MGHNSMDTCSNLNNKLTHYSAKYSLACLLDAKWFIVWKMKHYVTVVQERN